MFELKKYYPAPYIRVAQVLYKMLYTVLVYKFKEFPISSSVEIADKSLFYD